MGKNYGVPGSVPEGRDAFGLMIDEVILILKILNPVRGKWKSNFQVLSGWIYFLLTKLKVLVYTSRNYRLNYSEKSMQTLLY